MVVTSGAVASWGLLTGVVLLEAGVARLLWRTGLPWGPWLGLVALPVAYAALLALGVHALGTMRRGARIGLFAGLHVAVSVLGSVVYSFATPSLFGGLVLGAPLSVLPLVQLGVVPLAVLPFRERLAPSRAPGRAGSVLARPATPGPVRPTPTALRRGTEAVATLPSRRPVTSTETGRVATRPIPTSTPPPVGPRVAPPPGEPAADRTATGQSIRITGRGTPAAAGALGAASVPPRPVADARRAPLPAAAEAPRSPAPAPAAPHGGPLGPGPVAAAPASAAAMAPPPPTAVRESPPAGSGSPPAAPTAARPLRKTSPATPGPPPVRVPEHSTPPRSAAHAAAGAAAIPGAEPPPLDTAALAAIRAAFGGLGSLEIDVERRMGLTLVVAASPRLAREPLARTALRFMPLLGTGLGAQPVSQATLRGSEGALVLTPLGPARAGGPVLVVAVRDRAGLALVELRARGAAPRVRMATPAGSGGDPAAASPEAILGVTGVPAAVSALAGELAAWGPLAVRALRDPGGPLLLYLFLPPGVDAHEAGPFALTLHRTTDMDGEPSGIGTVESVILRLTGERVVALRPVTSTAEGATLLVAAGEAVRRPGLAYRELERAATRLGAA